MRIGSGSARGRAEGDTELAGPTAASTRTVRLSANGAQTERLSKFRRMRVDTTVETNIHYATDSSLLGDEVRVLPRTDRFARAHSQCRC